MVVADVDDHTRVSDDGCVLLLALVDSGDQLMSPLPDLLVLGGTFSGEAANVGKGARGVVLAVHQKVIGDGLGHDVLDDEHRRPLGSRLGQRVVLDQCLDVIAEE